MRFTGLALAIAVSLVLMLGVCLVVEADDGEVGVDFEVEVLPPPPVPPPPRPTPTDTTPPVISGVKESGVGWNSATIEWTTDEPSTSQVEYWASPRQTTALDTRLVTSHSVELTGLSAGTTYLYYAISRDAKGNESKRAGSFTTRAESSYTPPPITPVPLPSDNGTLATPSTPTLPSGFSLSGWLILAGLVLVVGVGVFFVLKRHKVGETKPTGEPLEPQK